ncbi:hypothetical protein AB0J55_24255 [Amycolatopsis sp. NPDC049688]|uniref:hypothetical protein n=1 Tax=Amycolatopsis sp. NPDC049688 TaxID=3154733 RepID=UPI003440DBA6
MRELPPEALQHHLYFAPADAQLDVHIPDAGAFSADLVNRLMLEPGLVIPDVFFFISERVQSEIAKGSGSWLNQAVKRGLVVPAFRTHEGGFEEVLAAIRTSWQVGLRKESPGTARILQGWSEQDGPRTTWPGRIGAGFDTLVVKHLMDAEPSSDSPRARRLWQDTEFLRTELLTSARNREADLAEDGLRRSTILKVIAERLELGGRDPSDTRLLLRAARGSREFGSAALRAFLLWVNEIYHFNQATRFGARCSFPVAGGSGAGMMPARLWDAAGSPADVPGSEAVFEPIVVRWPRSPVLAGASADRLLGVRTGDVGEQFMRDNLEFSARPSEAAWYALSVSFADYARAVCDAAGSAGVTTGLAKGALTVKGLKIGVAALTGAAAMTSSVFSVHDAWAIRLSALVVAASLYAPVTDFALALAEFRSREDRLAASHAPPLRGLQFDFPAVP